MNAEKDDSWWRGKINWRLNRASLKPLTFDKIIRGLQC